MIQANIPILTIQNVRIVNSYRTHLYNKISELMGVLLFSRIVQLNSWIVAVTPYFLRVTEASQLFSLSPTPNGVVGNHHRLRLVRPTSATGTINQPIQKKPGCDASDQERHRHPHHTTTQGEAAWINRV